MNIPRHAIIEYNGPTKARYKYVMDGNNGYLTSMTTEKRYNDYSEQEITDYIKCGIWTIIQDLDRDDLPNVDDLI